MAPIRTSASRAAPHKPNPFSERFFSRIVRSPAQVTNMNSGGYTIHNPNPDAKNQYDTDYGTRYPGSQREYFEVYAGPIST